MRNDRSLREKIRGSFDSLGKQQVAGCLAALALAGLALTTGGCAGGYYEAGYGSGFYAPDYGPYYGEYGYGGAPYGGFGGFYGGPDIVIGTSHYHHYYGNHHYAGNRHFERGNFSHGQIGRGHSSGGGGHQGPPHFHR